MHEHDIRAVFDADGLHPQFFDAALDPPERIPAEALAISDDDWIALRGPGKRWDGKKVVDAQPPPPDMPALRQTAFAAAMAYGNGITGQITGAYADAEARSWTVQEEEARAVLAGDTLPDGAMLPQLAKDKGVPLKDYAVGVVKKADAFRQIAVAAVRLRRGAEGLLSPTLDTPEKLEAAVEALRAEALAAARALGLTV